MRSKLAKMGDEIEQLCPGRRVADAVLYRCPLWCGHCSALLQSLPCQPTCSGWTRCHSHSSSRDTCMAATWPDNILLAITNSLTTMGPYGARFWTLVQLLGKERLLSLVFDTLSGCNVGTACGQFVSMWKGRRSGSSRKGLRAREWERPGLQDIF